MLRFASIILGLCWFLAAQAGEPVPAYFLRVPDSVPDVFVAEAGTASFHRFERTGDGELAAAGTDYMSIGLGGAGKTRKGDQRTPLGIYFIIDRLDTTRFHEKYGPLAFPLDYPNDWDRRHGRSGDGIWVHGVDDRAGRRPPLDTDGCVALPNDRLQSLAAVFRPNVTPVIVTRELEWSEPGDVRKLRSELEAAIDAWATALEQGDMATWLAMYDDEFRHWGMDKTAWAAFSLQTVGRRAIEEVTVGDLLLLADPEEPGLYLGRFSLRVRDGGEDGQVVTGTRRIYWRRSESGALRIIAEGAG